MVIHDLDKAIFWILGRKEYYWSFGMLDLGMLDSESLDYPHDMSRWC